MTYINKCFAVVLVFLSFHLFCFQNYDQLCTLTDIDRRLWILQVCKTFPLWWRANSQKTCLSCKVFLFWLFFFSAVFSMWVSVSWVIVEKSNLLCQFEKNILYLLITWLVVSRNNGSGRVWPYREHRETSTFTLTEEYWHQKMLRNAGVHQDLEAERRTVTITHKIMENCQAECIRWRNEGSAKQWQRSDSEARLVPVEGNLPRMDSWDETIQLQDITQWKRLTSPNCIFFIIQKNIFFLKFSYKPGMETVSG